MNGKCEGNWEENVVEKVVLENEVICHYWSH